MFYLIGLGLHDEKDITVRGLEIVKNARRVYLEAYTSILMVDKERLEAFYGREVLLADRDMVETASDDILSGSDEGDVALLVVGDPFGATTHTDIVIRARELGITVDVVHNASIMNAVGACGLQLYNFGQTVSVPFWTDTWKPDSWLARIEENAKLGLHTLVLLDIKVKEQSIENLARGRKIYEPPRYMTPTIALHQIISAIETATTSASDNDRDDVPSPDPSPSSLPLSLHPDRTLAISLSRVGTPKQGIRAGSLASLSALDEETFGDPLHSLVIVGRRVHPMEIQYAGRWAHDEKLWWDIAKEHYGVTKESS
ncbi:Diphthine synthase [Clavulina sp. PMI_390]|nr:Diphthine synthase [Clavulina sp. PMI_390]